MRRTANIQSYNETLPPEKISGTSRLTLPKILPYPQIDIFAHNSPLCNMFCYVVKSYGDKGISVLIYRHHDTDQVVTLFGDWAGNSIDLIQGVDENIQNLCVEFMRSELIKILELMRVIKLDQAQYFFGMDESGLVLCDVQVSLNKMIGPGMVKDVFGKVVRTQEVMKIEILDERAVEAIFKGAGSYEGDLILKPSKFKLDQVEGQTYKPLYAKVVR